MASAFLFLNYDLWSSLSSLLFRVRNVDLIDFFPVLPALLVEEVIIFLSHVFGTFVKIRCLGLSLGLLLCSMDLCVCFCANAMLSITMTL